VLRKQNWSSFGLGENMNSTNRYVALDVETTGFSPKNGDRVIEIGAVAIRDGCIAAEFSSLIDAGKKRVVPFKRGNKEGNKANSTNT